MCVDYRRLNSIAKFNCFPLPRLDEELDAFSGSTVFSSLDLAMAYHRVPVKRTDVQKTAFITHVGLFEIAKMPFGLCNAPSSYQRLMTSVLQGLIGRICLAYLDNVIVFSKRRAYHITDLQTVLDRIRDAGLKLKPAKCNLFCEQVLYFGHVISAACISRFLQATRSSQLAYSDDCMRTTIISWICKLLQVYRRADSADIVALRLDRRAQGHRSCAVSASARRSIK